MPKPQPTSTRTPLFDTDGFTSALVVDAALASEISYDRGDLGAALAAGGFTNVTADIGLPAESLVEGFFVNGNASGIVLEKDAVLYVAFAGTSVEDPLPDVLDYWQLNGAAMTAEYYGDVSAMMDAAMTYAADPDSGVTQVVATGHSLGGSAVDGALAAYDAEAYPALRGITFNSPTSGLLDDGRELNVGYENDFINEIIGDGSAGNAVHNLYYAIQPGEPMPDPGSETSYISLLSKALQAWTSPAHDIARFPEALAALADSPVYEQVSRGDVVVLDGSGYGVSLDAMADLSAAFDTAMAGSSRVGLVGQAVDDVLGGSAYGDAIDGGAGNDVIVGLGGDDLLWGGEGLDTFLFTGRFGKDVVKDYEAGDILSFQTGPAGGEYLASLAALQAWSESTNQVRTSFTDAGLVIAFAGGKDKVTLEGVGSWDLMA